MGGDKEGRYFFGAPETPTKKKKKLSYWEEQQRMHEKIAKSDEEFQRFRERERRRKGG